MLASPTRKTPVVARLLGIRYYSLIDLIRNGHIEPPEQDSSGHYAWTEANIEAARQVVAARRARRAPLAAEAGRAIGA